MYVYIFIFICLYLYIYMYKEKLASNEIFPPSKKIHREICRAKDLSAPIYICIFIVYMCICICIYIKQDQHQKKYSDHQTKYIGKYVGLKTYQQPCTCDIATICNVPLILVSCCVTQMFLNAPFCGNKWAESQRLMSEGQDFLLLRWINS
jgi:ABC-type amino acid transport system permease subunit